MLLGDAIQYASALIAALQKAEQFGMGAQRYSFRLFRIINILEQRVLWQTKMYSMAEINAKKLSCLKLETVTGVVVKLQTPLRIRRGGKLLMHISFETLIRNITKRIVMIVERYGGWVDYDEVKNNSNARGRSADSKRRIRVRGSGALFQPVAWENGF